MELIGRPLSEDLKQALADMVYDTDAYLRYPGSDSIQRVEFRRGCAELEVTWNVGEEFGGGTETTTIDAAPVLTVMLQGLIGTLR